MTQAQENEKKYGVPPTLDQINQYLASTGLKVARFERYFGIPTNVLKFTRMGLRSLPKAYWHIFYEALKLERGISYKELRLKHKIVPKQGTKSGTRLKQKAPVKPYPDRSEEVPSHLLMNDALSRLKPK